MADRVERSRAKPTYAYAVKRRGVIDIDSIDMDRPAVVRRLNRPGGESVVCVRISEIAEPSGLVAGRALLASDGRKGE
jgi:hypothetical protein